MTLPARFAICEAAGVKAKDFFAVFFYFWVGRSNKTLIDRSRGKQRVLFPLDLNVSRGRKQNSLFPSGPVINALSASWQKFLSLLFLRGPPGGSEYQNTAKKFGRYRNWKNRKIAQSFNTEWKRDVIPKPLLCMLKCPYGQNVFLGFHYLCNI